MIAEPLQHATAARFPPTAADTLGNTSKIFSMALDLMRQQLKSTSRYAGAVVLKDGIYRYCMSQRSCSSAQLTLKGPLISIEDAEREVLSAGVLTRVQTQVGFLIALGLTNTEIAVKLKISPHTARRHTEAVMGRLGVDGRDQVHDAVLDILAELELI